MKRQTIVLTGASGVCGRALLPELGNHDVICLVHRGEVPDGCADVVRCNVAEPNLGLGAEEYDSLAERADCVIHSAAVTDWAEPNERFRTVNVGGTENVVAFAQKAQAPIYQLSTSFIQALRPDAAIELPPEHIIVNYVRSKIDAERLVRESGLPHTIFRPTNLIGDSQTGEIARNQIVQLTAEFMCRGKVPILPTRPGTLLDVIPQDLFAKLVAAVVDAEDLGKEYWLTYGEKAMSVGEAAKLCTQFMERIGKPIAEPRVVDSDDVAAVEAETAQMSPMAKMIFARLLEFSDGMTACGVFPSDLEELAERYGIEVPDDKEAYVNGLDYWAQSKGLIEPAQA